ncbi:MAG TPA: trigger factor [Candidatus Aminicenantes bacterium]|nr:trigger factor [Candidatus Aminicenantes bacterium]
MKEKPQIGSEPPQAQSEASSRDQSPETGAAAPIGADGEGQIEQSRDLWVDLDIQAPSDEVTKRIDAHAERYAAKADIPGFRKGKVPAEVIRKRYRQLLIDEALSEVIESFVSERIRKDNLQVVSRPEVKDVKYEEGGDLQALVRVEVLPEVKLPDLDTFTVSIPADQLAVKEFNEAEQVDHFLEHNRKREAVSDRPIAAGDLVMLKHQTMNLDDRRMSPRKPLQVQIATEAANEIPELDKELIGRAIGEEIVFRRKYPKDFERKPWAGKEMEHHATVEAVYSMVKPELDNEFLKSIGFESREAFLERLKNEYEKQSRQARDERIMAAIAEQLVEANAFPIPDSLLHQEMMQAIRQNPGLLNVGDEKEKETRIHELQTLAARNIRFSLLVEAVKQEFGVKADAEELEKRLREMAESSGVPLKEVRKYYAPAERRRQLLDSLEKDKALEILREKVTIKEV